MSNTLTAKVEGRYDRFSREQIEQMLVDTQEAHKKTRDLLRNIVEDVEAMRGEPPFDYKQDGIPDMQEHWFTGFSEWNSGLDEDGDMKFQWPNLGILVDKAKELLK